MARYLSIILTATRIILGFVLVYAGMSKLGQSFELVRTVYAYEVIPPPYGRLVAAALPTAEIVLGCCLLARLAILGASIIALSLFLSFTLAQANALVRGLTVECGCFAGGSAVTPWTLSRAGVLALMCALVVILSLRQPRKRPVEF